MSIYDDDVLVAVGAGGGDVVVGRMPVGGAGDPSEFDYVPPLLAQFTDEDKQYVAGDGLVVPPPIPRAAFRRLRGQATASADALAALAAAQQRLATIQAQLAATKLAIANGTWQPPGAATSDGGGGTTDGSDTGDTGDAGTGSYEPGSPGAAALQLFRQSGGTYDPFEDAVEGEGDILLGLDELDDIMIDSFEREITDEELDHERSRASVHRGAAYLQDAGLYPPFGASSGQEGGEIIPEDNVQIFGLQAWRQRRDARRRGR